jgi:hypothetical protein
MTKKNFAENIIKLLHGRKELSMTKKKYSSDFLIVLQDFGAPIKISINNSINQ